MAAQTPEDKAAFVRELARFLAGDQAAKSIALQIESKRGATDPRPGLAKEWARLRSAAHLTGWVTEEEAEKHLRELLV